MQKRIVICLRYHQDHYAFRRNGDYINAITTIYIGWAILLARTFPVQYRKVYFIPIFVIVFIKKIIIRSIISINVRFHMFYPGFLTH